MRLRSMGVMNITPDSFSDGGELDTSQKILEKVKSFGSIHALDIGAESTAPMNKSISWQDEWQRWQMVLPLLPKWKHVVSADTYHPETIFELVKYWKDNKLLYPLFWNDVSGKFDGAVRDFLKEGKRFEYVYCHNRAPLRELTSKHMDYVAKEDGRIEEELRDFFAPHIHERVIFDPCVGFSKSYDENWFILDHFAKFQKKIGHDRWLIGFSRKSFLRKKYKLEIKDKDQLDKIHSEVLEKVLLKAQGEIWVRTHRPELISQIKK
jgi:dihydropteroate synthase